MDSGPLGLRVERSETQHQFSGGGSAGSNPAGGTGSLTDWWDSLGHTRSQERVSPCHCVVCSTLFPDSPRKG